MEIDYYPGDGVLGDDSRGITDWWGGHRKIKCRIALILCQGIVGRSQIQIQIGGQHVVKQIGRRTSCKYNVELGVGQE